MNDELRRRLTGLDPAAGVPVDPVDSDRARTLMETIMSTPIDTPERTIASAPVTELRRTARGRRSLWLALGGLAGTAAAVVGLVVAGTGDDTGPVASAPAAPPLELTLAPDDPMAMCLAIDATILGGAEVAFAGTVAAVGDGVVALDVDRWYRGGDAAAVELAIPEGFHPALDGIEFVAGTRYLVTATAGQVNGCGMSGVASPELEQLFDAAFPA